MYFVMQDSSFIVNVTVSFLSTVRWSPFCPALGVSVLTEKDTWNHNGGSSHWGERWEAVVSSQKLSSWGIYLERLRIQRQVKTSVVGLWNPSHSLKLLLNLLVQAGKWCSRLSGCYMLAQKWLQPTAGLSRVLNRNNWNNLTFIKGPCVLRSRWGNGHKTVNKTSGLNAAVQGRKQPEL